MDYEDNTPSRNVAPETSPSRHITPSQERSPPDVAHAQEPSRPRHTQTPSSNPYTAVLNQPSRGAAPESNARRPVRRIRGRCQRESRSGCTRWSAWQERQQPSVRVRDVRAVSYTHLRAHETGRNLVCRLLLEKKKK